MPRRDRNLFVEVSARGLPKPSKQTAEHLARYPGLWRIVPDIGRLLVFERVVDNRDTTRVTTSREVKLAGTFDSPNTLANYLNMIHLSKLDGALHVSSEHVRKTLYFQGGVYLSGRSTVPEDRLGHVLASVGLLNEEQKNHLVDELGDGARLGAFLVGKGVLTTPKVYEGLRIQAERIFYSILELEAGTFYMVQPVDMTEVPAMLRLDVQEMLLEGMRRLDEAANDRRAADTENELRRSRPVSIDDLPMDGAVRIVDAYNEALRRLFSQVGPEPRDILRRELLRFLRESAPYSQLFDGVEIGDDGALDGRILSNISKVTVGEPVTMLQLGLNELLFFVMFAAGDAIEPEIERKLQTTVAEALQKLPKPRD